MDQFKGAKYYDVDDKKTGIVLLHAYTGSPNDMNLLANLLNREGYGVLSPLFEGHSKKDINDLIDAEISEWQHQTYNAVKQMSLKYKNIFVFGLSMGGIFATWAMTQNKLDITAGGVFNSPVVTKNPLNVEQAFKNYAEKLFNINRKSAEFEKAYPQILSRHRQQMQRLEEFKADLYPQINLISQPFYIAQSGADELIAAEDAYLLKDALQTKIDFNWFPDNTHVITVNHHREDFEQTLLEFINKYSNH